MTVGDSPPEQNPGSATLSLTDGRVPRFAALVREALAVLAAILVAFALDAWWDRWVERADMLDALDAVAVEVGRNVELVDSAAAYNQSRAELVNRMLTLMPAEVGLLSDEELADFSELPDYDLVTLEMGAATAFIEGGFLATLDDRALRAQLAGLPRLQTELDEEAGLVRETSATMNELLLYQMPMELFLGTVDPASPAASRAILQTYLTSEEALQTLLVRTFFLTYLYGRELGVTKQRLEEVATQITAYSR